MKKIILLVLCCITISLPQAQTITTNKADSVVKEGSTILYKPITLSTLPGNVNSCKITIKATDSSATQNKDYLFLPGNGPREVELTLANNVYILAIKAPDDGFTELDEKFILSYEYTVAGRPHILYDTITIKDAQTPAPSFKPDTARWSAIVITGSSFDFFEKSIFKNFAGEVKVFLPNLVNISTNKAKGKSLTLGLQFGLFNYNYYESDSSGGNIRNESYLTDPTLVEPVTGSTKYVRDIYGLNSQITYKNWGFYFNPMIPVNHNEWFESYFELQIEGVWRKKIASFTKTQYRKDTLTYSDPGLVLQRFPGIRSSYTEDNYFDFYIGAGLPIKVNLKKLFKLYLEPAVGLTTFSKLTLQEAENNKINSVTYKIENRPTIYGMCKFQLATSVAPVDIVLGGEVRAIGGGKQLDKQKVFKAVYLGAIIPFDKLIH